MKTKDIIVAEMKTKRERIVILKDGLKYADHGAYGQDRSRIATLEREVEQLGKELMYLI
jgi:hypothetical protein